MKQFTYNRYNINTFIAGYPGKNDNCGYSRNREINDNMVVGSFCAMLKKTIESEK